MSGFLYLNLLHIAKIGNCHTVYKCMDVTGRRGISACMSEDKTVVYSVQCVALICEAPNIQFHILHDTVPF